MEKDWVQDIHDILKALNENLQETQNQHNLYADRHRFERSFEVGYLVYLRLQLYKKMGGEAKTLLLWSLQSS